MVASRNMEKYLVGLYGISRRVAIVTGGGSGIGRELACGLAHAGARVLVTDVDHGKATAVAEKIAAEGGDALSLKVDVSRQEDVTAMREYAVEIWGQIDVLVNSAGFTILKRSRKAEDLALSDWESVVDVNLTGTFLCCKIVGRKMIDQKCGSIINVSSMSSFIANRPQPFSPYCASKAGVNMLTKALAVEWAPHGVRVNAIAPGYVETPMTEYALKNKPEMVQTYWIEATPLGRIGVPGDLVGATLFLASDAASYITGHVLCIDGGFTCQ